MRRACTRAVGLLLAATLVTGCSGDAGDGELGDRPGPSTTTSTTAPATTTVTAAADHDHDGTGRRARAPTTGGRAPRPRRWPIRSPPRRPPSGTRPPPSSTWPGPRSRSRSPTGQLGGHPEWDDVVARGAARRSCVRPCGGTPPPAASSVGCTSRRRTRCRPGASSRPGPPTSSSSIYQEAGDEFDIPWSVLAAINLVETGTGRIRGTSTAGAQGPMQFLPATWAAYGGGGDINDTHDAIFGAARYLAANNGATDIDNALFRYNHSDRYVRGVKLYADLIAEHPRAFLGLHHWGVWYLTSEGEVYLPVGYEQQEPIAVSSYLAEG